MSELKAGVIVTPHDEGMCFHRSSDVMAVTERETEFYLKSEADKVITHHKYKRCVAMAKICENRLGTVVKPRWWDKWRKIWLALAKKFKEVK